MNVNTQRNIATDAKWLADPSGRKNGNLERWHKQMAELAPNPSFGDLVPVPSPKKNGHRWYKVIGFKNGTPIWERGLFIKEKAA
jgi:hypothetical protein